MPDDLKPALQVLPFRHEPPPTFEPLAPPEGTTRFGLFPMAGGDVVLTPSVFNTMVALLENGSLDDRRALARTMRLSYFSVFTK